MTRLRFTLQAGTVSLSVSSPPPPKFVSMLTSQQPADVSSCCVCQGRDDFGKHPEEERMEVSTDVDKCVCLWGQILVIPDIGIQLFF